MPGRARMYLPDYPCPVVQRGVNSEAWFVESGSYQLYLELWQECSKRYGVLVHACCLMTNHIHILATPQNASSISNTMKVVGGRSAQYINKRYNRTGSLWEGRDKSSPVQSERYFHVCSRYIELNPVAANRVKRPEAYQWSSYLCNAWGDRSWLTAHDEYSRPGSTIETRTRRYRELFQHQLDDVDSV